MIMVNIPRSDGHPIDRCWLDYKEIVAGGTLQLILGPKPNIKWGASLER